MTRSITFRNPSAYVIAALVGIAIGGMSLIAPLAAAAAVGGVAFILTVLRYPIVLCYVMVAAITLLSGVPRGRIVPMLRLNELLLVLSVGMAFVMVLVNRDLARNLKRSSFVTVALIVLLIGTVFVPVAYQYGAGRPASIDAIMDMTSPVKFFLLFLLFATIPRGPKDWRPLITWIVICAALVSVVGLLQAARVGPVLSLIGNWYASEHTAASLDSVDGRVTSLLGAWNSLGMLLMMALALGWAALQVEDLRSYRLVIGGASAISFLCLVASGSFAGLAGTVMSIAMIEMLTNPPARTIKRLLIASSVAVGGVILALPVIGTVVLGRLEYQFGDGNLLPSTFVYRFWIWEDVFWPSIVANPLLGTSLDIPAHFRWLYAESHYISLLFRFGLVGMLTHLLWSGLMLAWLLRWVRNGDKLTRMMAAAAFATLVSLLIASLTNEVFLFTGCIDYLWILFAVVAARKETVPS
jgi:hypothetical protein